MADLVQAQFLEKKEEKKMTGGLAEEKVLRPGKFGLRDARYTLIMDSPIAGVEGTYFGILRFLEDRQPFGLSYTGEWGRVEKIKDIYTAGETSSYWGMTEQRKGVQQDKFQQLMASVGQLLKTLFQILRELRIIDERLLYYEKSDEGDVNAIVALKSIWVDMVEGGSKNPASVLGLSSQVGFVTLPDLFFSIHPKTEDDVAREVDKLQEGGINRKVREVLGRKLTQYLFWKKKTHEELRKGREFKLKYMRQHYQVIRLYLNWLRPYLKNVQRLQMQGTATDKDIIAAFETSKIELEIIAVKKKYLADTEYGKEEKTFEQYFPVVRVRINYVAMPEIAFQAEGQRGAIHRGRTTMIIDAFVAEVKKEKDGTVVKDDLEEYRKKIEGEDMELLTAVDQSILALKDDLEHYLIEAGEVKKKEEKEEKKETVLAPFKSIVEGFKELTGLPAQGRKRKKGNIGEKAKAEDQAKLDAYLTYNIFKKSKGMFTPD